MRVVVIGAGLVGLAAAWRLAQNGADVLVLDDGGPAASPVAAGMLAAGSECSAAEQHLLGLARAALHGFPAMVAELEAVTGEPVGLRREGTLCVGVSADDHAEHERLAAVRDRLGVPTARLDDPALHEAEPFLSPRLRGAVLARDELSIDNRRLWSALRRAALGAGARVVPAGAQLVVERGRAVGVRTADQQPLRADVVVLAAGARAGQLAGLPDRARPPVLPVKGHVLRLRPADGAGATAPLRHTVRALVHGREVYLVPRADGELVVGATVEHRGFDLTVQVAAVRELLRLAHEVVPVVDELALHEISVGLRPGSPDNAPLVGWSPLPGLFVAGGHHRNGVLLCGATADEIVRQLDGAGPSPDWAPFGPERFVDATVA
jgi:glycine oxidase